MKVLAHRQLISTVLPTQISRYQRSLFECDMIYDLHCPFDMDGLITRSVQEGLSKPGKNCFGVVFLSFFLL